MAFEEEGAEKKKMEGRGREGGGSGRGVWKIEFKRFRSHIIHIQSKKTLQACDMENLVEAHVFRLAYDTPISRSKYVEACYVRGARSK